MLNRCLSTSSLLPCDIPALHTPPKSMSAVPPNRYSGTRNLKDVDHGRYRQSFAITESAMTNAWPTSAPLIPAMMLILLVAKVDNRAMYR